MQKEKKYIYIYIFIYFFSFCMIHFIIFFLFSFALIFKEGKGGQLGRGVGVERIHSLRGMKCRGC